MLLLVRFQSLSNSFFLIVIFKRNFLVFLDLFKFVFNSFLNFFFLKFEKNQNFNLNFFFFFLKKNFSFFFFFDYFFLKYFFFIFYLKSDPLKYRLIQLNSLNYKFSFYQKLDIYYCSLFHGLRSFWNSFKFWFLPSFLFLFVFYFLTYVLMLELYL